MWEDSPELRDSLAFRKAMHDAMAAQGRTLAELLCLLSERYHVTEQERQWVLNLTIPYACVPAKDGSVRGEKEFLSAKAAADTAWREVSRVVDSIYPPGDK